MTNMMNDDTVQTILVVVAVALVSYLLYNYLNQEQVQSETVEGFYDGENEVEQAFEQVDEVEQGVQASETLGQNEEPRSIEQSESSQFNQMPAECYPKDVLTSAELLPQDSNSRWAQAVPSGSGSLQDKNFLNAGFHVGINTVGQTLRNANRQLRSEVPNPQVAVSPWMQTTIQPDTNRKPMEIGA